MRKSAVVLLSGGLDSATALAIAREDGYDCYALTVNYGQRHVIETIKAKAIGRRLGVIAHKYINLNLAHFGGSALTDWGTEVPKTGLSEGIPVTYVPTRNTVLLGIAASWAESLSAEAIFAGMNAVDYSGYPDCRPEFIEAFQHLLKVGTKRGVEGNPVVIKTPLIALSKSEIIELALQLRVPLDQANSCYHPDHNGLACGRCDSCRIRLAGFEKLGVKDPIKYQEWGDSFDKTLHIEPGA